MPKENLKSIRFSNEEIKLLNSLCKREGISYSAYIRNLINNQERVFTLSPDEVQKLEIEFNKITRVGGNLNQLMYHLNTMAKKKGEAEVTKSDIKEMVDICNITNGSIRELKELIVNLIETKK